MSSYKGIDDFVASAKSLKLATQTLQEQNREFYGALNGLDRILSNTEKVIDRMASRKESGFLGFVKKLNPARLFNKIFKRNKSKEIDIEDILIF